MSKRLWIDWHGGKCPVAETTFLDVRFRDGEKLHFVRADVIKNDDERLSLWNHTNSDSDIIAYRVRRN